MVSYNSPNFGGYRSSYSGDKMVFVCHVTLPDHVIKALKFDGYRHCVSGNIIILAFT